MRVISKKCLREFWSIHADAEDQLKSWYKVAKNAKWRRFSDVRAVYGAMVDRVGECYVFNIAGNKYRLITVISKDWTVMLTCVVLTHKEYDKDAWKTECAC